MTITKDIAAKLAVAAVAVAMVFAVFAPAAKAQTTEDLQQMINDLLAQVAALQAQLGQGGSSAAVASVCPYTWTRDLNTGATGMDVMKLQQFLNSDPDTRVAAAGMVGSAGMETEYYGPATAAAVSKFQVKYRSEILSPANLVNPTGYFGPSSRAKANSLCVAAPVVDQGDNTGDNTGDTTGDNTGNNTGDNTGNSTDNGSVTLAGAASVHDVQVDDPDDDTIQEGGQDVALGKITLNFENGDAKISRLDLRFVGSGTEQDPWDTFDTLSLWVNGDKIAEKDASSRSDYLNDNIGSFRFSGLDLVANQNKDLVVTVAANVQKGINGTSNPWTMYADSFRFFDGEGVATNEDVTTYTGSSANNANFTVQQAGFDDELIVKTSSNDPNATTFQLKTNRSSDWYTTFAFDLDTKDSVNDITLNEVPVTVVVSTSTFDGLVADYELVIDGQTITRLVDNNGSASGDYTDGATTKLTFDVDRDVTINAGDRVEAELRLKFRSLATGDEGATVTGQVTSANALAIDAEGADTLTTSQLSGSATGDPQTLRTEGLILDLTSITETKTPAAFSGDKDTGSYVFKYDVTAFGNDFYLLNDASTTHYTLLVDGSAAPAASSTATLDISGANNASNADYVLSDGDSATLTFTVETDGSVSGSAKVQLDSQFYSAGDDTTTELSAAALPATDWTSDSLILN